MILVVAEKGLDVFYEGTVVFESQRMDCGSTQGSVIFFQSFFQARDGCRIVLLAEQ